MASPTANTAILNLHKKVQQSWQTSTLAMHLPLAHSVSMPVIFCLLPSSSIVILVFTYFLQTSEQHVWELWLSVNTVDWFDASSSGNAKPRNPYITSTDAGLHFCWSRQYMHSSANFRTVFFRKPEPNPLDAEFEPDFNAKWPLKIIQGHPFRCQWRATKGLHSTI